ncbi:MAG: FAD:protein FMN transferase [Candidatus Woesearchaeota archaeon]
MRLLPLLVIVFIVGCTPIEYQSSERMMDTIVTITVSSDSQKEAQEAMEAAFKEINRVEKKFTIHEDSPIYSLNKEGFLYTEDEELKRLLRRSVYYSQISKGSFDITIKPILTLYDKSFANGGPPSEKEIDQALERVGWEKVIINETGVFLKNTTIDLGGIAKGYAIDKAIETLQEENVSAALVNAGGDIAAYGRKSSGDPWVSALRNPDEKEEYIDSFEVKNEAVATSGNYERYFDESREFHHIVDPKTGRSVNECISVTVIAPSAAQADALSTALFVMGNEGKELARAMGVSALFVFNNKSIELVDWKS